MEGSRIGIHQSRSSNCLEYSESMLAQANALMDDMAEREEAWMVEYPALHFSQASSQCSSVYYSANEE